MEITRREAVEIFTCLGFEDAERWKQSKMQRELESLHENLEDGQIIGDDELDNLLDWLVKAGKDGEPIKIVAKRSKPLDDEKDLSDADEEQTDSVDEEEEEEKPKPAPKKKPPVKKTPPPPKKTAKKKHAKPVPPKKTTKKAPAKEELQKQIKSVTTKQVSQELRKELSKAKEKQHERINPAAKGRPYIAGYILRKYGLDNGVTDEMITEMDNLCKSSNLKECESWLKSGWHIVHGYVDGGMGDDDLE